MWQPSIHGDTITDIWDGLETPQIYYPLSEIYPGIVLIVVVTIIHIVLNKLSLPIASSHAKKETNLTIPSVMRPFLTEDEIKMQYMPKSRLNEVTLQLYSHSMNEDKQSAFDHYRKQHKHYEKHISKFQESIFKVIVFGFVYVFGLYVLFTEDFYWDSVLMWSRGVPQPINNVLRAYYSVQLGYHGHRAVFQFFEYARPDFWAMFTHHWVAAILIIGSWLMGYIQLGCVLVLSNDNTDLIMPVGKLFGYLGYPRMKNVFGALFLLLWFPFRICLYPYKILYSTLRSDGGYHYMKTNLYCWICVGLMWIIYFLQFYWSKFVAKAIYDTFMVGTIIDGRSDTEGTKISKLKKEKQQKKKQ